MPEESAFKYYCPNCSCLLKGVTDQNGVIWACPSCHGCAIGLGLLQKISKPELIGELWRSAKRQNRNVGKTCPACRKSTLVVTADPALGSVELDVCGTCQFIWFDKNEVEKVPRVSQAEIAKNSYVASPNPSSSADISPPSSFGGFGSYGYDPYYRHRYNDVDLVVDVVSLLARLID